MFVGQNNSDSGKARTSTININKWGLLSTEMAKIESLIRNILKQVAMC